MKTRTLLIMIYCMPFWAQAVSISEVAWMGDSSSANHEWIELYNDGEAVLVDGWTLTDGMNLNIVLNGTIAAQEYVVLERTSEESAPGSAFLIYTGAIVNTGATLTLKSATGEIKDQVSGGENWLSIGGDNVTKETAQYSSNGWVTDTPTPGASNRTGRVNVTTPSTPKSTTSSSGSKRQVTTPLVQKPAKMSLAINHQAVAYVGQPIRFLAEASGYSGVGKNLLRYHWNFGDAHATSGIEVWHTYDYPGEYVVTLATKLGRDEPVVRTEVTILPVALSLSFGNSGLVHVNNDSPYDIDVSGYKLVATKIVNFPPRSLIKAGGTVSFSGTELGSWALGVRLFDRSGGLVEYKSVLDTNKEKIESPVDAPAENVSVLPVASLQNLAKLSTTSKILPTTSVINIEPEPAKISADNKRRFYGFGLIIILLGLAYLYTKKTDYNN